MVMIMDSDSFLFALEMLDEIEAKVMILFLESEKSRHIEDVINIEEKIFWLKKKHEI